MTVKQIHILCFSKDRPLQLQAYIESLHKNADFAFKLFVLMKSSNNIFEEAYRILLERYKDVVFITESEQQTIYNTTNQIVNNSHYIMFGCDDVIFTNTIGNEHLPNKRVIAFSFRLAPYITYCQPVNLYQQFNGIEARCSSWDWTKSNGDFGYPFELNATVYESTTIKRLLDLYDGEIINSPNDLEVFFDRKKYIFQKQKNIMTCYNTQRAITLTINRVQNIYKNKVINEVDVFTLLNAFIAGKRINIDYYKNKKYQQIHIGEYEII